MNRHIEWNRADWNQTDEAIAENLGCAVISVRRRRERLGKEIPGRRKKEFISPTPALSLRLEEDVYDALEFLGILAGKYNTVVYITDVIKILLIQAIKSFGETYFEKREFLEHFLSSDTAKGAEFAYERIETQVRLLKEAQERFGLANWGLDLENILTEVGIDRGHRNAYRRLIRIKRSSNYKPYVFRLRTASMKDKGLISVTVYAPVKNWTDPCELAFESRPGKPLVPGLDFAEDNENILHGLPKEASPRELFHKIFRDRKTVDFLRPRVDDNRISEENCEPEAYLLFQQSKERQQPFSDPLLD